MPRGRPGKRRDSMVVKSAEFIGWALGGLEREIAQTRERLAALNAEATRLRARIRTRRSSGPVAAATFDEPRAGRKRTRNISAEGRRRISEAMKKRWAEYRKKKKKG